MDAICWDTDSAILVVSRLLDYYREKGPGDRVLVAVTQVSS
jgi:hypothetical protein